MTHVTRANTMYSPCDVKERLISWGQSNLDSKVGTRVQMDVDAAPVFSGLLPSASSQLPRAVRTGRSRRASAEGDGVNAMACGAGRGTALLLDAIAAAQANEESPRDD